MESTSRTRIVTRNGFEFTRIDKGKRLRQRSGIRIVPFRPGEGRSRRGLCPWTARRGTPRRSSRSRSPPAPSSSPFSDLSGCAPLSVSAADLGILRWLRRLHTKVPPTPMDDGGFSFGLRGVVWAGPSFPSGSKIFCDYGGDWLRRPEPHPVPRGAL